jgi:molybdopterin biosynthesis enzyme
MIANQRLPATLTPLDIALAALLEGLEPVAPRDFSLAEVRGGVAAAVPPLTAMPPVDTASTDGFALCAQDLVGASSYSPLPLPQTPCWVEAGDPMPEGCDCVVDAACVDARGPLVQALAEALPWQGVRRRGSDLAAGHGWLLPGRRIGRIDRWAADVAGLRSIALRQPRLRLVHIPARAGINHTAQLIGELAEASGTALTAVTATARDAAAIAAAIGVSSCDLVVTVGGSGVGRSDATLAALATCGAIVSHGIAMQPGRTAAVGRIGKIPVIALPGAPDQALAGWWALILPVLDRLSGRLPRPGSTLPLRRKIASSVGIAEIALLEQQAGAWLPLAIGEWSMELVARAEAWLLVPAGSEGFAAGTLVHAYLIRDLE